MIQDLNLRMDYSVAVTTSAASTYWIDSLAAADAMPGGSLAMWKVICFTAPGATAGTIQIQLQTCNNSLFDSTAVTLMQTAVTTLSLITAQTANIAPPQAPPWPYTPTTTLGPILVYAPLAIGCLEFVRTYYVIAGNASLTMNVTSEIVLDGDKILYNVLSPSAGGLLK